MSTAERRFLVPDVHLAPVPSAPEVSVAGRPGVRRGLRRLLVGLDVAAAGVAWALAFVLTGGLEVDQVPPPPALLPAVVALLTGATVALLAQQQLYLTRVCSIRAVELARLGRAAAIIGTAALLLPRFLPIGIETSAAVAGAGLFFTFSMFARGLYRHWLLMGRRDGRFLRPVVIIGTNEEGCGLYELLKDHPELGFRTVGVIGDRLQMCSFDDSVPYLGAMDEAEAAVASVGATGVMMAASAVPSGRLNVLIRSLLRSGIHVHLSSGLRGFDRRRLRAQTLAHEPLFYIEPSRLAPWQVVWKRTIDVAISALGGIVFALPLVALAAVAIKAYDRGPVFFRQQRVGRGGREFTMYKLRTMVPNAHLMYDELARTLAGRDGPLVKLRNDPRRTKVGRVLERLSIDELPQLWNVLKGDMSLVGPRPAEPKEVAGFDEELCTRFSVRPGISGLWQIEARDNPSFAAYKRFDLFYLENWSISLDLAILVATVQRVLFRGVELMVGRKGEMAVAHPVTVDLTQASESASTTPAPGAPRMVDLRPTADSERARSSSRGAAALEAP